jgi:DNA processing protein
MTVVSGLALGIDGIAHQAALQARGRTLAVVAHGLDQTYPREHKQLRQQILKNGAIISEFPLGVQPLPQNFPRRNRIISGLSRGVLVVEAKEKSGALITARWAGEQGREVFAVPGPFNSPLSRGTHALIQDGAKLVTNVQDVLDELPIWSKTEAVPAGTEPTPSRPAPKPELPPLAPEHDLIRKALASADLHLDQLAECCGQTVPVLLSHLLALELLGLVKSAPGPVYHWLGNEG